MRKAIMKGSWPRLPSENVMKQCETDSNQENEYLCTKFLSVKNIRQLYAELIVVWYLFTCEPCLEINMFMYNNFIAICDLNDGI